MFLTDCYRIIILIKRLLREVLKARQGGTRYVPIWLILSYSDWEESDWEDYRGNRWGTSNLKELTA